MEQKLHIEVRPEGGMVLTLNRPEKRNAIDFTIMGELREAIKQAETAKEVKLIVLKGSGSQAFCSGGDLSAFHSLHTKEEAYGMLSEMGEILYDLAVLEKPVIAFLNGKAVGGGCEIAAACDLRVAVPNASFGFIQANQYITTGWGGGSLLQERIPSGAALDMLLSGRIFSSEEGVQNGFLTKVVENEKTFFAWLDQFESKSADVLKCYKEMTVKKMMHNGLKERMDKEIRNCSVLWESDGHLQAVGHFLKKS